MDLPQFGIQAQKDVGGHEVKFKDCSETVIMCDVFTVPGLYEGLHDWLYAFTHAALKFQNEAVIEGQGSTTDRHADKKRGVTQEKFVMDSFVDYNGPVSHEANEFIIKALDKRFERSRDGAWHFTSADERGRTKPWGVFQVVDRHTKKRSRLPFMECKD
eukprot:gene20563-24644_t